MSMLNEQELLSVARVVEGFLKTYVRTMRDIEFHPLVVNAQNVDWHVSETPGQVSGIHSLVAVAETALAQTKAQATAEEETRAIRLRHMKAKAYKALLEEAGTSKDKKVTEVKSLIDAEPQIADFEEQSVLRRQYWENELIKRKEDVAVLKGMLKAVESKHDLLPGEQQKRNLLMRQGASA